MRNKMIMMMTLAVSGMLMTACLDGGDKWPSGRNRTPPPPVDAGPDASTDAAVDGDATVSIRFPDLDLSNFLKDGGVTVDGSMGPVVTLPSDGSVIGSDGGMDDGAGAPVVIIPSPDIICECRCYKQ